MLHETRQKLTERWDNMTPEEAAADRRQQLAEVRRQIGGLPPKIIKVGAMV
jgi:ubiquinone biosynthesis protein UbiJ